MSGNSRKEEMLQAGEVEYFFDANGDLWKGPTNPDGNLHYSRFEGFTDHGDLIWVCRRSDPPEVKLNTKQFEDFLYRQMREIHRKANRI